MKNAVLAITLASLAIALSGCDLTQMPQKMDETNATTSSMNEKMSETNAEVAKSNVNMGVMSDAIHKQTLLVALNDMYDEKHTANLVPVPFDMFAGGKTFAETANETELVDWFYATYKQLVEATADDSQRVAVPVLVPFYGPSGNKIFKAQYTLETRGDHQYEVPQYDWVFPTLYIEYFNHKKDVTFNAMQVVAAFIPQSMLEQMVDKEIGSGELREQTVYMILNLRDVFTRGALLKNSLYEDKLKNLKQVSEALRLVENLEYVSQLPYADRIGSTVVRGYLNISENYVYSEQADKNDLSKIHLVQLPENGGAQFTPALIAFDPTASINNPNQFYYSSSEDNLTVAAVDQGTLRTQAVHYDPKTNQKDWKELQRHFLSDLPKDVQKTPAAQILLSQIKSHIQ
jgi:hypothetical protein